MKKEKSAGTAMLLNFLIWGSGYFYLEKQVIKGLIVFILYFLILFFSIILMLMGGLLILPIIFWVIFWSLWCSIFLAYDAYKISNEYKPVPLNVPKVKMVVYRSKVRAKKK